MFNLSIQQKDVRSTRILRSRSVMSLGLLTVLAAASTLAHAQGGTVSSGCGSSPENPTAVLALIGSLTAAASALRDRLRR